MNLTTAKDALKKYFGYDSFRPMQAEIIQAIFDKKDALVLMPTGGGKSICFQIPAVTMEGVCVVISPLISLMKDQVEALRANGIRAAFLNSSLSYEESRQVEDDLFNKNLDLIYVSPEKACSMEFLPLLKSLNVNLIAIDEAHCISSWGHDFRPEYTKIKFLKAQFPNTPTVALTATADKMTRNDIVKQMELANPEIFIASFDRPNLSLEVRPGRNRLSQITEFINGKPNQPGIIYCLSRKSTEDVCAKLLDLGIDADFYHAGMPSHERARVQERFIKDETQVICATIAFGMGIDKSNVRWIIHYNLPKNLEGYYQEIGRAGRDGVKAETLLFYSFGDVVMYRKFLDDAETNEHTQIKHSKLNRMYQYATAVSCRRKMLLNYFNENMREDCGNCDVCKNPPTFIDGTIIAQKALSAIYRLQEKVATGMLIDVLRGSARADIMRFGYNNIKTYGAGRDISKNDWQNYFEQLLNQGFVEIAYDDYNKVKLTESAKAVLFEGQKVQMVEPEAIKKRQEAEREKASPKRIKSADRQRVRDELFEHIRIIRLDIARKKGVPPYIVFNDATLEEMAAERPHNMEEMMKISGVGEAKLKEYGRLFLDGIQDFLVTKKGEGVKVKGVTVLETMQMYRQGLTPEEIAERRGLNPVTIMGHLAKMYEKGENVVLSKFVNKTEIKMVLDCLQHLEAPYKMKEIFDMLDENLPYEKIRWALAYYNRKMKGTVEV
jgi:ATP-dependent DNA helicase RecQ